MHHTQPKVEYKVFYRLNPEYEGAFQLDKIGDEGGLQGTFGKEAGGLARAKQAAEECKAWFNTESRLIEKQLPNGKKTEEIRTTMHDNVIVWIEKYVDGFLTEEEPCESEEEQPKKGRKKKDLEPAA